MPESGPVSPSERNLTGLDFFLLWTGAAISLSEIWAGGLLLPLGFLGGLAAILLGHVIGNTPMALSGLIGSRHGVPAIVSTRGALGNRGSFLPAILNVIQLVGWTAVMLWVGGQAAARAANPEAPNPTFWMLAIGVITTLWAAGGHVLWKWMQRVVVLLLLALSVLMTAVVLREYGARPLMQIPATGDMPFMLGLDLVIAMPISWMPLVSDYSRYASHSRSGFWGTWWGYLLVSSWMYVAGLCTSLATKSATPESMILQALHSGGFLVPAVVIVLFSTITTTFLDIYSNAVSVRSMFPKWNERAVVFAGGAVGTALAVFFPASQYETFLLFIGSAFCPLFGVVLADYFLLKKGSYDAAELFQRGRYWYSRGVNPRAIAAWAIGFVAYHACATSGCPIGASIPSLLAGAALYGMLMRCRGLRGYAFPDCGPEPIGLYPVVDRAAWVEALLPMGVTTLQLRIKDLEGAALDDEIRRAVECARRFRARLFINDHWQLAIRHGAYGVHIGQEDLRTACLGAIAAAGLRLGVSTQSEDEVRRAVALNPSYIAVGAIYPTPSKVIDYTPIGVTEFRRLRTMFPQPAVVIGGVTLERAPELRAAGADGMAVISDVLRAKDMEGRVKEWLDFFKNAGSLPHGGVRGTSG